MAAVVTAPAFGRCFDNFSALRDGLNSSLIERQGEIDVVLTVLLCRENPLLVGDPGTGKSLLLDSVLRSIGGSKFTILFSKFTSPEEVFGPVSVAALKADRFRRITTGRLPEATGAFLDEIFKASSAILNTLLRILNERQFENDGVLVPVPLQIAVAASNEWPGAGDGTAARELGALFDRFLFRRSVKPIQTAAGRHKLLWGGDLTPRGLPEITPEELVAVQAQVKSVSWTDESRAAFEHILRALNSEGIVAGDRRQKKSVLAAQAAAWLSGCESVEPEHLEVLADTLWVDPAEQPAKCAKIVAKIANPTGFEITGLLAQADEIIAACDTADLAKATAATAKLDEIAKKLVRLGGDRGKTGAESVRADIRRLKSAIVESL